MAGPSNWRPPSVSSAGYVRRRAALFRLRRRRGDPRNGRRSAPSAVPSSRLTSARPPTVGSGVASRVSLRGYGRPVALPEEAVDEVRERGVKYSAPGGPESETAMGRMTRNRTRKVAYGSTPKCTSEGDRRRGCAKTIGERGRERPFLRPSGAIPMAATMAVNSAWSGQRSGRGDRMVPTDDRTADTSIAVVATLSSRRALRSLPTRCLQLAGNLLTPYGRPLVH